jgi:hypothetical protein
MHVCNVITAAITSAGTLGRRRPLRTKSPNISLGNGSRRCEARHPNTLPALSKCPVSDSASRKSR